MDATTFYCLLFIKPTDYEEFDMSDVFISYVHENSEQVQKICNELSKHGVDFFRDKDSIDPGIFLKDAIRKAIKGGSFFMACFSKEYNERDRTYMNEELILAIEELRIRPKDRAWFIPVKLNQCEIPNMDIGAGKTLQDIWWVEMYDDWDEGIRRILKSIQKTQKHPNQIINLELLLKEIETIQNQAEIALQDAKKIVDTIPKNSFAKPEKILRQRLDDYNFRFNGQFTVINSERYIIFHKEKEAIGRYYSQFLDEYDKIYENYVIGRSNGILRVVDFLLTETRSKNVVIPASGILPSPDWIRFNISPFLHFECLDWYILVEGHIVIDNLRIGEIRELVNEFRQNDWLIVETPYHLRAQNAN